MVVAYLGFGQFGISGEGGGGAKLKRQNHHLFAITC